MSDCETVASAYEQFFVGETLSLRDAKGFLSFADLSKVLSVMEQASERNQREPLRSVKAFIFSRLKSKPRPLEIPCKTTLHFDAAGNKILST
jgi:hypothetical protein